MLDALALKHERRRPNLVTFLWSFPFLLIPLCSHETPTRHSKGQLWNPLRDQFTLSFQLTKPNYFVSNTSHRCRNHCLSGNLPSFLKHFICLRSQIYCVAINNIKINYFIVLNTIIVQIIFIVIINIIMILHHVMLLKMNSRRIAINTLILVLRRFFLRFGGVCFIIFAISWYSEPLMPLSYVQPWWVILIYLKTWCTLHEHVAIWTWTWLLRKTRVFGRWLPPVSL